MNKIYLVFLILFSASVANASPWFSTKCEKVKLLSTGKDGNKTFLSNCQVSDHTVEVQRTYDYEYRLVKEMSDDPDYFAQSLDRSRNCKMLTSGGGTADVYPDDKDLTQFKTVKIFTSYYVCGEKLRVQLDSGRQVSRATWFFKK